MYKEKKKVTQERAAIKVFTVILILVCLILASVYWISIQRNNIEFRLLGRNIITVQLGDEYKEEGFIARINNRSINNKVIISSNVNNKKIGCYKIKYNLKIPYLGINKNLYRQINIKDTTKPNLTINSEKKITAYVGDKYSYPTYTAIDNNDGDITKNVLVNTNLNTKVAGTYEINYCVKDLSNNETKDKIIIEVKKKKNPYVVVSISKQTLKYYEYDKLVLTSYIVTGINNKTPTGTFRVLNKATNIILKGKDYESFVNYWIAFRGASLGFHDASWRSSFGGTIYKTNGSHGCVNMPYSKVRQLYNKISIGTPVYIYK